MQNAILSYYNEIIGGQIRNLATCWICFGFMAVGVRGVLWREKNYIPQCQTEDRESMDGNRILNGFSGEMSGLPGYRFEKRK